MIESIKNNSKILMAIKVIIGIAIILCFSRLTWGDGVKSYYNYKDYDYQNNNDGGETFVLSGQNEVRQVFTAAGNVINNICIYYGDTSNRVLTVAIKTMDEKEIINTKINTDILEKNEWNKLGISTDKLQRGSDYYLVISSDEGLDGVITGNGQYPKIYKDSFVGGEISQGKVLSGISFTYCYITLASVFEFLIKILVSAFIAMILCFSVANFEKIYASFKEEGKQGISFAIFLSVSAMLLYNPIGADNTKVISFKRIIGSGINSDVDVARRTSNFNYWFIAFGILFIVFFMGANYFLKKEKSENSKKILKFLDSFIIVANCNLILRCITFFKDSQTVDNIFYFSQSLFIIVVIIAVAYMVFGIEKYISVNVFECIAAIIFSVSVALTVFYGKELGGGRLVIGIICLLFILTFTVCRFVGDKFNSINSQNRLFYSAVIASFIPLATSLYIELIHVLIQHDIFVAHPAKYYKIACIAGFICYIAILFVAEKKKLYITDWKRIAFPVFAVGVTCLSIQIPLTSTYNPHLFEGANASILMSDFLNFGDIPIVQHYGGHMMTGVWEGVLYALINCDYAGIVSPYESLINVLLVLLFYYMISKIWNREMGLVVALLFPFLGFVSYYALGIMICLAAMSYVKKNTWSRAIILWAAFVWCTIYRLDLGFAFGAAVIIALIIYVVVNKNWKALKQLGLSLIGWGIIGGALWFIICLVKDVNPINRLIEFLLINLSNQNWAYNNIGNVDNTIFAWGYIIVPFVMVLALLYTVYSKNFRENIGTEKWILLLILNLSYFENYSRGLVRHSLTENSTTIVFWCAYLFLALFVSFYKDDVKLFVPLFMIFILLNRLFVSESNFSSLSVVDSAVSKPESIIQSWKPTRFYDEEEAYVLADGTEFKTSWEKLKYEKDNVNRVVLEDKLVDYVAGYEHIIDELLEDDETFVDFVNKTVIYSIMGRRCPVYVAQSPLQLSGEFTQEEFIKEIDGVPVVLMPVDGENYEASNSLDGLTNAYRYYKVYEYICQNYRPLCKYDDEYAVWCLPSKYDEYLEKVENMIAGKDYINAFLAAETIGKENVKLSQGNDETVVISSTGIDPKVTELQNIIDISEYIGLKMKISIDYSTDTPGLMQLYFTTGEGENYSSEKVVNAQINEEGTAIFDLPVTKYTKLRLDIPEESNVVVNSFKVGSVVKTIDYGYDGPVESVDDSGNTKYEYVNALHNTFLAFLPRIWAESDSKNASDNNVICDLTDNDGIFVFANKDIDKENGNYLKISATYDGLDTQGMYDDDDEYVDATVLMGTYNNGQFVEKYRYNLNFNEGDHEYLIRCSTDYYWYTERINAVKIVTDGKLRNFTMQLLEGD